MPAKWLAVIVVWTAPKVNKITKQSVLESGLSIAVRLDPSNVQPNRVLPSSEGNERHTRYTSSVANWQGSHHTVETHWQAEWNTSINVTEAQRNRYV
ncbi:uncharacterized protein LACBIDRAFT_296986 [Laccaria bicolor S238N-H82]|uniref:Predicted protein n=1 Tax=Laccaria bicolor (strain S238N-H82 / ATCC MYA-4686) TaxID=486041 RepID=B0D9Q4_LACBS|nr:uncharacterized protein LACBIDRAFT_296986 [Laccaria bicolor S238N-H82]EDR08393.1 predicted protein [Laccaria bicolor S238N-H82]|eukprot:XP_001880618.1 predicted protein [Laccaria bicolor S238N-H82]